MKPSKLPIMSFNVTYVSVSNRASIGSLREKSPSEDDSTTAVVDTNASNVVDNPDGPLMTPVSQALLLDALQERESMSKGSLSDTNSSIIPFEIERCPALAPKEDNPKRIFLLKTAPHDSKMQTEGGRLGVASNAESFTILDHSNDGFGMISKEGCAEFEEVSIKLEITESSISDLLTLMKSKHYRAADDASNVSDGNIFIACKSLFEQDYEIKTLDNKGGILSWNYPVKILIPMKNIKSGIGRELDIDAYTTLVHDSNTLRVRSRFVAPAILFGQKFICRSGTLSNSIVEAYEKAMQPMAPQEGIADENFVHRCYRSVWNIGSNVVHRAVSVGDAAIDILTASSVDSGKKLDSKLLHFLDVGNICDLMVEDRKKFLGANISSSEKVNIDKYRNIKIDIMPYPGCEFFKRYHDAGRFAEGLIFDWNNPECTAELDLSQDDYIKTIDLDSYKEWDLNELTKTYIKLLLLRLVRGKKGILVHCTSGWNRTPLIISLLRMSLWADQAIHQSLKPKEMAYLTLAYDWYLFGHDLPTQLSKREEILHYCFNFLEHIATDDFSIAKMIEESPEEELSRIVPAFEPGRRKVLKDLRGLVMDIYRQDIILSTLNKK